jgi:ribosomal protein L28
MAKITGKNTRPGSNKATGRDYSKEKAYQSTPARNKYRSELNAEARERGIYGKRDAMGKDLSHKKDGKMVLESKSLNRRRQGANGKSTKK